MGKKAIKKIIDKGIQEDKLEVIRNHPEIIPELHFLEKIDIYVKKKKWGKARKLIKLRKGGLFLGAVAGKDVGDVFAGGVGNPYGLDEKEVMKAMKAGAAMKRLKEGRKGTKYESSSSSSSASSS